MGTSQSMRMPSRTSVASAILAYLMPSSDAAILNDRYREDSLEDRDCRNGKNGRGDGAAPDESRARRGRVESLEGKDEAARRRGRQARGVATRARDRC